MGLRSFLGEFAKLVLIVNVTQLITHPLDLVYSFYNHSNREDALKLLVLNNLHSGLGDGAIFDYVRTLMEDGDEVVIRSSDGTTDMRTFLHDAEDFDLVAVAGGDGSTSSVAHMLAGTGIPVLPFPAGTANLLALNLESPSEPHALVKMTREFKTMDFDIGEVKFPDGKRRGFTLMAGAGYDAKIMEDAEPGKKLLGPMAYFTSAFANVTPQFSELELTIDGKTIHTNGVGVLIINFSRIQFDLTIVHDNTPRDGMFDIVVLNTKDALGLIPALFAAIRDRGGEFPTRTDAFEVYQGREVSVIADPPLQVQVDGDVPGRTTPFKARLLPMAARYVVSDECIKLFDK